MAEDRRVGIVRLCPYPKLIGEKIEFAQFTGPDAHYDAEKLATQWALLKFGRSVEWIEMNPWDQWCNYIAKVKGGGPVLPLHFTLG